MASHHSLLRHTPTPAESPAKVFAKLKCKVQREAMFARQGRLTDNNNTLRNARETHGADLYTWRMDDKENRGLGSCSDEAEALTLSPIPTPRKSLGCTYMDLSTISPRRKVPYVTDARNEFTPTKRAVLESTAVSQQPPVRQSHRAPPAIRDSGVFRVINGTPSKPREDPVCGRSVSDDAPLSLDKLMSPAKMFSSMKERLRKRKWEQQANTHTSKEPGSESTRRPKERKLLTAFNDVTVGDLGQGRGTSVHAEMNPDTQGPTFTPQTPISKTRRSIPLVTPAKTFAHIKERESGKQQQEIQKVSSSSSSRELTNAGHRRQFPGNPASAACDEETEDRGSGSPAESETPGSRSTAEAADSQSDDSPAGDVPVPSVSSQPVLLEDPLVLNSPQISIPKKREAVSRNHKWPMSAMFPSESLIYLKNWFLERNRKGLYVDGILRDDGIPWHSNIIVERVSNSVLKTVSGRLYVLVGKMNTAVQSEFPKWFLRKFVHGFPPNWKILYEKFVSESRNKETERNNERRRIRSRTVSETPDTTLSTKQRRQKPLTIPVSCPPPSLSSSFIAKVSRSGRVIKPPLEYWKGGRVTLDAHMNVTIHECYDSSICKPEVTTAVSTRVSNTPFRVLPPHSEDHDKPSAPLRKLKAPQRKHNQTKSFCDRKPSSPNEHLKVVLAYHISSPEEQYSRLTMSSQRRVVTGRNSCTDGVHQTQSRPEQRSRKQTHHANRSSARIAEKKKNVSPATESPTASKETPQSDLDSSIKRRKKGAHRKNGKNKTQPSHESPSKQPSKSREDIGRRQRSRAAAPRRNDAAQTKHKPSKCNKISPPPPEPLAKPTQTSKKRKDDKSRNKVIQQERDEDEWTEEELRKLQEAVTSYPKHMTDYWANVAMVVGTRSAEECHKQHTSQGPKQTPSKKEKKPKKVATTKAPDHPVISARVGTLKRKQQVRQFLEAMVKDDVDDVFSSAYMQSKRFELPSMCPSDDQDFALSDQETLSPTSAGLPEAKTPQCLHITPGMMGSPSRTNDDKYIFQLQKRMKKSQFNVCKQGPPLKNFTPTPSVKRALRRCGNTENDTFVVWEMFPEKAGALSDSGEEEDFYFSDND